MATAAAALNEGVGEEAGEGGREGPRARWRGARPGAATRFPPPRASAGTPAADPDARRRTTGVGQHRAWVPRPM